jgi:hypothetical protein
LIIAPNRPEGRLKYGEKIIGKEEVCQTFRLLFYHLEKTEEGCHDNPHRSIFKCENTLNR